jgi:hypothetical protein
MRAVEPPDTNVTIRHFLIILSNHIIPKTATIPRMHTQITRTEENISIHHTIIISHISGPNVTAGREPLNMSVKYNSLKLKNPTQSLIRVCGMDYIVITSRSCHLDIVNTRPTSYDIHMLSHNHSPSLSAR